MFKSTQLGKELYGYYGRVLMLSVDGPSKGNPGRSGGGAILCNQRGQMFAVSKFYGIRTNMQAEIKALLDDISLFVYYVCWNIR